MARLWGILCTPWRMRTGSLVAIALISCGVTYVKGPDGKADWFKVECRRAAVCMKQAARQCPKGFLFAESQTGSATFYDKAPENAEDTEGKLHAMFARCGTEEEEVRGDDAEDEPFKPIGKPQDFARCGRNYDKLDDLASAWLKWHPSAEPADKPPRRSDFVNVCGDLPETAQLCLSVKYGRAHQEGCKDAFDELPPKVQIRLARLFEKDGAHPAEMVLAPPPVVDSGAPEPDSGPADSGTKKGARAAKPGKAPKDAGPAKIEDSGAPAEPGDATVE